MSTGQVFFHPEALEEAEAATRWYRERSPRAAQRFVEEIDEAIARVLAAPQCWPADARGFRQIKLPCFPFSIVYRERRDAIQIVAIAHHRHRPTYWKQRK
jgi:plasmid stabilization system protein ParE